jgi:hypothetical protein
MTPKVIVLEDAEVWCCALLSVLHNLRLIKENPLDKLDGLDFICLYARLLGYPHR